MMTINQLNSHKFNSDGKIADNPEKGAARPGKSLSMRHKHQAKSSVAN
ncbi:MAG: hypothetical protein ACI85H_000712 [Paracoccaceae bacterium]|jgi:hypothetical protein